MKALCICFLNFFFGCGMAVASIRGSLLFNKISNIKPVGGEASFAPLSDLPSPTTRTIRIIHKEPNGRRHLEEDCSPAPRWRVEEGGPEVAMVDEYYDEGWAKTMATVIFPAHIDRKHFEVTTQDPYLTVGTINGIGFHPATVKSEFPDECEKIYQEHMGTFYSDEESAELSEESLEVARLPFNSDEVMQKSYYSDYDLANVKK